MNKIVTESPGGLKVAVTSYRDGEARIETTNALGMKWSMWFDHMDELAFLAEVLTDYIAEHNVRKETDNG